MTRALAVLILVSLLGGCYANRPIGDPGSAVFDDRLLGRWLWPEKEDGKDLVIVVARFNEREYVVSPEHDFGPREALRAFIIPVDEDAYINAQGLESDLDARGYMFARYVFRDPDTVRIDIPETDALPHQVDRSSRLVEAIRKRRDEPGFFSDRSLLLRRVK